MATPVNIENQIKLIKFWDLVGSRFDVRENSSTLIANGILSESQCQELLKEDTRQEQNRILMGILLNGTDQQFHSFLSCLREGCDWLADCVAGFPVTEEDKNQRIELIKKMCAVPQHPSCFFGRAEDVKKITNAFLDEGFRIGIIQSFGGQGKTTLATVIAGEFISKWGIRSIMADMKNVSLSEDIPASLLLALKASTVYSGDQLTTEQLISKACQVVSEYGKKILIILDNCETALGENSRDCFYSMLQKLNVNCNNAYVLCTTRETIHLTNMNIHHHHLDCLSEDASLSLLQHYSQTVDHSSGKDLAEKCGFVPLLLHILGYHLKWGCKVGELNEELTTKGTMNFDSGSMDLNAHACINLTYKRLDTHLKTVYQILSLFPSTFTRDDACSLLEKHSTNLKSFQCLKHLQELRDISLLTYDETSQMYVMHSLIQEFAHHETAKDDRCKYMYMEYFIQFMEAPIATLHSLTDDKVDDLTKRNVRKASELFEGGKENFVQCIAFFDSLSRELKLATHHVVKLLAIGLMHVARYADSLRCFECLLNMYQKEPMAQQFDVASIHYYIGYVNYLLENLPSSTEFLKNAIQMYESMAVVSDYKDYYESYYSLTYRLFRDEKYAELLSVIDKCMSIAVTYSDQRLKYSAQAMKAVVKAKQGELETVMDTLQDIFCLDPAFDGKNGGIDDKTLNNAALALQFIEKPTEALALYHRCLVLKEAIYGEHHQTAIALTNIGMVKLQLGDTNGAEEFQSRALVIMKKTLGENHFHTAHVLHELARVKSAKGNHEGALRLYGESLRIRESLDVKSSYIADTLTNIGYEMIILNKVDNAVDILRRALTMRLKATGEYHKDTAETSHTLARAISAQGNHEEAIVEFERALRIKEQIQGDSKDTASVIHDVARELKLSGDPEGSLEMHLRGLEMERKVLRDNDVTVKSLREIADLLQESGKDIDALKMREEATKMEKRTLEEK